MTRILSSFAIIVAALAIIAGGTYSFFQDQESKTGTFSAGDLNLDLENPAGSTPYVINNWAPGESKTFKMDVKNVGTVDLQIKSDDVVMSGNWANAGVDKDVKIVDVKYFNNAGDPFTPTDPAVILVGQKLTVEFTVKFIETDTNQSNLENDVYNGSVTIRATDVQ